MFFYPSNFYGFLTCYQTYHTRYVLITHAEDLLCPQLKTIRSRFFCCWYFRYYIGNFS